jgi:ABC-type Mn2+/Zn2+ transport system ATPase subunit
VLDDNTQGVDEKHVQQMVNFMKRWNRGVNAVGLIINGQ